MATAAAASTDATSNGDGGGRNRSSCWYADAAGGSCDGDGGGDGGGGGWGVDILASSHPFSSASEKRAAASKLVSRRQWVGVEEGAAEGSIGKVSWWEMLLLLAAKG